MTIIPYKKESSLEVRTRATEFFGFILFSTYANSCLHLNFEDFQVTPKNP